VEAGHKGRNLNLSQENLKAHSRALYVLWKMWA
jgi:hypothetical protein